MGDDVAARSQPRPRPARLQLLREERDAWNVCVGLGEPWVRVYGDDLDRRTLPYIAGPGFTGRLHGLNPPLALSRVGCLSSTAGGTVLGSLDNLEV